MKKFFSFLMAAALVPMAMSAQLYNAPVAKVLNKSNAPAQKIMTMPTRADLAEGQYIMGNYTSDAVADSEDGLGLSYFVGSTIPTGTIIDATQSMGNQIVAVRVGLANAAQISRVFIWPVDDEGYFLDGVEVNVNMVGNAGWNVVELPEPYTIANENLFIGFDYYQEDYVYPISCVAEGYPYATTYCYLYDEYYGYDGWYDVGATSYGNLSVQAIVEGEAPEPPVIEPAVPANPVIDGWYDCGYEGGYTRIDFTLPTVDVDGNPLVTDYISYSIFMDDDQLYTFLADEYPNLDEDMSEIGYNFTDSYDFRNYRIYFYHTNAEGYEPLFTWRIGIQVYYTVDGVRNESDIVYYEVFPQPEPTAVNELDGNKQVAGVRYYNVAGQEVAQPNGMTIQVTTYTDGTTNAVKVIK